LRSRPATSSARVADIRGVNLWAAFKLAKEARSDRNLTWLLNCGLWAYLRYLEVQPWDTIQDAIQVSEFFGNEPRPTEHIATHSA
jgi:hypothetical protein